MFILDSLIYIQHFFKKIPSYICQKWMGLSSWEKIFARILFYVALGFIAIRWNPFDINDKLELLSQKVVADIVSPWYPFGDSNQTDKVVVLLVNGPALDLISQVPQAERIVFANEWPILYKDHSKILKSIMAGAKPKQIFIDIEFHKIRNTDDSFPIFIDSLKKINEKKGVKFSHAIGAVGEGIPDKINEQFLTFSNPVINAWNSAYMPLIHEIDERTTYLSPALQMYANLKQESIDLSKFENEMFVFWRSSFDGTLFSERNSIAVCDDNDGFALVEATKTFINGMVGADSKRRCLPHKVIYLDELQQMLSQGNDGKKKIKRVFDNATVLYGTDYVALGDRYESPAHGALPGIFYHAMALENLLEFDERYFKSLSDWFDAFVWAFLSLILFIYFSKKQQLKIENQARLAWGLFLFYIIFLLILIVYGRFAPANIIALFGLFSFAWLMAKEEQNCSNEYKSKKNHN